MFPFDYHFVISFKWKKKVSVWWIRIRPVARSINNNNKPRKNLNKSKLIFFKKKKNFEPKEPTRCVQIVWPVKKCIFFFLNNNFFFFRFYLRPVAPSRPRRKAVHFGAEVRLFRFSCRRTVAACASHSSWCRVFDFLKNFRWFSFLGFLAVAGFCLWLRHERIQRICLWINRRLFHRTRGNSWFFICSGKAFVSVEICISPTGGTWLPLARNLTGKKKFEMAMNRHSWRKVDYRPEDQKSDGGLVDFFTAGFDRYATKMCDSGRLLEHDADTERHCSSFAYETLKRTAAIRGLKVK